MLNKIHYILLCHFNRVTFGIKIKNLSSRFFTDSCILSQFVSTKRHILTAQGATKNNRGHPICYTTLFIKTNKVAQNLLKFYFMIIFSFSIQLNHPSNALLNIHCECIRHSTRSIQCFLEFYFAFLFFFIILDATTTTSINTMQHPNSNIAIGFGSQLCGRPTHKWIKLKELRMRTRIS